LLFLEFDICGFTAIGEQYIRQGLALEWHLILAISAPEPVETSDSGAAFPSGGVPYPDLNDLNADLQNCYKSVTAVLNATPPEDFNPTINQLYALIQSMRIAP